MKTKALPANHSEALPSALKILRAGGLVAFPTDTVYGLGALAFDTFSNATIHLHQDLAGNDRLLSIKLHSSS